LPFIGKIFEKILYFRLYNATESYLNPNQHGFRKNRSCETAVSQLTQDIFDCIDERKGKAVVVFIDLKKAFNSVKHQQLIVKLLRDFDLPVYLTKLLNDYLKNRVSLVELDGYISKYYCIPTG